MLADSPSQRPHVVVIGGGGTGGAIAHDLALRGVRVTVLERGEVTSGTTGRHHGLLHSGGRYAVADRVSALECIEENRVLRRIAAGSFEENDGLFAAVCDEDMDYLPTFVDACEACGIPTELLTGDQARRREPGLSDDVLAAVRVPDATMDAMRLPLRFFATAQANGAAVRQYTEVVGLRRSGEAVTAVEYRDDVTGEHAELSADLVVNAAGPWAQRVAAMAGVEVPLRCSPGVLVAVRGRWCDMVVNRLHPSGDGDIVVPQRGLSVIGTSSWVVDDPDELHLPAEHVLTMLAEGSRLVPAVARADLRAAWSAVRPLVGAAGSSTGRELSRTFACFDHDERDGVRGFVTISGGKATTLRAMAEKTADVVCRALGVDEPCRTAEVPLLPHTAYRARPPEPASRGGHTGARARGRRHDGAGPGGDGRPLRSGGPVPVWCATPTGAGAAGALGSLGAPGTTGALGAPGATGDRGGAAARGTPAIPTRLLRVRRWKPGWATSALVDYEVEVEPGTTVLDALRAVRWHEDSTLTLRHSCCHASCGTCGMRVDGREVLGCVTRLGDLPAGPVLVEPMAGAPLVSDLVTDPTPLWSGVRATGRPLVRTVERAVPADLPRPLRLEDCLECGLCVSACPIAATDPGYLGPAVLGAAWRALQAPGADTRSVLALVDSHDGCWRCHLAFACSQVCPSGAEPGEGIGRLRGAVVRDRLRHPGRRARRVEVSTR